MKNILLALVFAASSAQAAWFTGNDLLRYLQGSDETFEAVASGYIIGVAAALDGDAFCIPTSATIGQLKDVVRKRLIASPNVRHESGAVLVAAALMLDFPCQNKPKGKGGAA